MINIKSHMTNDKWLSSSEAESHSRFDSSARRRRGRLPEERRCQDAGKACWVHVIEEVCGLYEELGAESFVIRTSGHRTDGAQHLAAVPAAANDVYLRPSRAIRLLAETEAPAQARTEIPLSGRARAVATDARRAVVDGKVLIVVKTRGDVIGAARTGVEARTEAERFHQSERGEDVEAMARVIR